MYQEMNSYLCTNIKKYILKYQSLKSNKALKIKGHQLKS